MSEETFVISKKKLRFLISWANRGINSMWNPQAPSPDIVPSKRKLDEIIVEFK